MESVLSTVLGFLSYLPSLVAWGIGVVFCFSYWQSHPRKARLTLIAIGLAFINMVVGVLGVRLWTMMGNYDHVQLFFGIQSLVQAVLHASMWIIVLWAIFRSEAKA